MANLMNYPFEVRPLTEEEGGGWLVSFPDLPGCIADGDTVEQALKQAEGALVSWIEGSKELGYPVPDPAESKAKDYKGKFVQRLPKSLHEKLARRAKDEGVSVNMLVTALIAEGLGARRAR
jgi:antitoxin HicB